MREGYLWYKRVRVVDDKVFAAFEKLVGVVVRLERRVDHLERRRKETECLFFGVFCPRRKLRASKKQNKPETPNKKTKKNPNKNHKKPTNIQHPTAPIHTYQQTNKHTYIFVVFEEDLEVGVLAQDRVRRDALQKDLMHGHRLLEGGQILALDLLLQLLQLFLAQLGFVCFAIQSAASTTTDNDKNNKRHDSRACSLASLPCDCEKSGLGGHGGIYHHGTRQTHCQHNKPIVSQHPARVLQ
jgi:hypothetical protein